MILGVTGLARAGKDVFADYLIKNYGYVKLGMSDCLKDELVKTGRQPTKDNMSLLGDEWRRDFGYDIVIRRTLEHAKAFDKAVITGFRSLEEVEFMRKSGSGFYLVSLVASDPVRFARRTPEDPQDEQSFFQRDRRDIEKKGLDKVIASADYVIKNDSTGLQLYRQIDRLVASLTKS